ncbi:hypothetical protein K1719_026685 [Acacia pycnantha]|nr:hypothetical protein K1719_026685 [Acacia pycnantha]
MNESYNSHFFTIVSLLPFKEVAITSIISKRWPHAWRSTSNIDFNKSFFVNPEDDDDSPPETKRSQKLAFVNFINRFLENYQEPLIGKFSKPSEFSDTFQRCITFAFQRGVRQLELDFSELTWDKDDNDEESGGDDHHVPSFRLPSDVFGVDTSNLKLADPIHKADAPYGEGALEFVSTRNLTQTWRMVVSLKQLSIGYAC